MSAQTILLVDDEAVVRRATKRVLERAGFQVVEATNGQEAVDAFAAQGRGIAASSWTFPCRHERAKRST